MIPKGHSLVDRFHHERPAADEQRIIFAALDAGETKGSPIAE
jgi:hypothetical protein